MILFFLATFAYSIVNVFYMAPFFSGGGYGSESLSIALGLHDHINKNDLSLQIFHHADVYNKEFVFSLKQDLVKNISELISDKHFYPNMGKIDQKVIIICHSEPGSWFIPEFDTIECPINPARFKKFFGEQNLYVVGRTMFETDRIPSGWPKKLNQMKEIWVPTKFHEKIFRENGVTTKIFSLPEPIDTGFFDPDRNDIHPLYKKTKDNETVFVSVFKLEERKNWKTLLDSYFEEFNKKEDNTTLLLLLSPYHNETPIQEVIEQYIESHEKISKIPKDELPAFKIFSSLPLDDLPNFYLSGDVFVLPTRGEGWGRPFVESMSMRLAPIATNWSGQTEFMNKENSYLINVKELVEVDESNAFKKEGHKWAEPDKSHLKKLLRLSHWNKEDRIKKGKIARKTMIENYSMEKIANIFFSHFKRIEKDYFLNEREGEEL